MRLRDYLGVLRRRKWTIIRAALIVAVVAVLVGLLLGPTYEGVAVILVSEQDPIATMFGTNLPVLSTQPERSLQTHVQLIQLRPLLEQVIKELDLDTDVDDLAAQVSVDPKGQTNLLTIAVRDRDPERAAQIANSLADAYIQWTQYKKHVRIAAAEDQVEKQLAEARAEIERVRTAPATASLPSDCSIALQSAADRYNRLLSQRDELRMSDHLQSATGSLVASASADTKTVSPKPVRDGLVGLLLGLLAGLAIAFVAERYEDALTSSEEAAGIYGVPVLGEIPIRTTEGPAALLRPGTAEAQGYAELRNSLAFVGQQRHLKSVLITSAEAGEGKSTVAANLAAAFAHAGDSVVFLDCDFRRPAGQQHFAVDTTVGLSDVLTRGHDLGTALQSPIGFDNLLVLPAGRLPENPSALLSSAAMQEMVAEIAAVADWVIIDTPPLLAVADAAAAARWSDGVLIVTQVGVSTSDAAKRSRQMLENVGARMLGVVSLGSDLTWIAGPYGRADDASNSDGD